MPRKDTPDAAGDDAFTPHQDEAPAPEQPMPTPDPEPALEPETPEATATASEEPMAPTLDEAFYTLCQAMAAHLEDDLPAAQHAQEIQAWMHNAGTDATGKAQQIVAWRHCVQLLEGVVGQKLTPG